MSNNINLMAIYIANGFGALLALETLFGNDWKHRKRSKEYRVLRILLMITAISCIVGPITFSLDGVPGVYHWLVIYIGNIWLYLGNILIGPGWVYLINKQAIGYIPKNQKIITGILCIVGIMGLLINFFSPLVYSVSSENIYSRGPLYWVYTAIEFIFIIDGLFVFYINKSKGVRFKFFPVIQFIVPVAIGVTIQSTFYGISVIWPSLVISICGVFNGFRNEELYLDMLTGLYNRLYLNQLMQEIERKKITRMTAMMLDMNGFKEINDTYGHNEGDNALIEVGKILKTTVGPIGTVIRYAGDEFVIFLNTDNQAVADGCALCIRNNLNDYNAKSGKDYELSLSISYDIFNMNPDYIDEIIKKVDNLMYEEKKLYYNNKKL